MVEFLWNCQDSLLQVYILLCLAETNVIWSIVDKERHQVVTNNILGKFLLLFLGFHCELFSEKKKYRKQQQQKQPFNHATLINLQTSIYF